MTIPTCPTCGGRGWIWENDVRGTPFQRICWCDWGRPQTKSGQQHGLHWINERKPDAKRSLTRVVMRYMNGEALSVSEINQLRWYVGQWVWGVAEKAGETSKFHDWLPDYLAGWEQKLANATSQKALGEAIEWLRERGIDPF